MDIHKLRPYPWTQESNVANSALVSFLKSTDPNKTLTDRTYERLAVGAAKILGRRVNAAELRGEAPPPEARVVSFIGAGAEVFPVAGDETIEWVDAPPGFAGEALIVRGDSGLPMYEPGDVLFATTRHEDPSRYLGRIVVVQVAREGPRLLKKLLKGSRKNRYHLLSVNPAAGMLEDQALEWVAPIDWVRKKT